MRTLNTILAFIIVSFLYTNIARAETYVEYILDASGSMAEKLQGIPQIDAAKSALTSSLSQIPDNARVALRLYGHRVPKNNKAESCKDTELIVKFESGNRQAIKDSLSSYVPNGYTPIAYSLLQAARDFPAEAKSVVILLSDGNETCDGNPVQAMKKLKDGGIDIVVHTIGFNVDQNTRTLLSDIAAVTGGKYFDARSGEQLKDALVEATKEAYFIEKEKEKDILIGQEIRGGDGFETAVPLPLGVELKLNHHQKKNEYDYFYFEAQPGDSIVVTHKTLDKSLNWDTRKNTYVEVKNERPYAGIEIVQYPGTKIFGEMIYGKFNQSSNEVLLVSGGKYFVKVGADHYPMHKDGGTFNISITTDPEDGIDSSINVNSPLPLIFDKQFTLKKYSKEPIYYSFQGKTGQVFRFNYTCKSKPYHHTSTNVIEHTIPPQHPVVYYSLIYSSGTGVVVGKEQMSCSTPNKVFESTLPKDDSYSVVLAPWSNLFGKDSMSFEAKIQSFGDLGTDRDAGDSIDTALDIKVGEYKNNTLSKVDKIDFYRFLPEEDGIYQLTFIPDDEEGREYVKVKVMDDIKSKLYEESWPFNEGKRTSPLALKKGMAYYIKIDSDYINKVKSFTIRLQKI